MGTADGGHYYSLIKDREKDWLPEDERWFEFNDNIVEQFNPEDLKNEAFGGEEKTNRYEVMGYRSFMKSRNAYLLVYDRVSLFEPPEENSSEQTIKPTQMSDIQEKIEIPKGIHEAIIQENTMYWYSRYMLHNDYFEFALNLCSNWNTKEKILKKYPCKNLDYHLHQLGPGAIKRHGFQLVKINHEIQYEKPMEDIDEKAKERLNTGYKDEYELESQNNNFEAELAHRKRKLKEGSVECSLLTRGTNSSTCKHGVKADCCLSS